MNDDTLISRLAPVTDEQAAALVSRRALAELADEIVRTPPDPSPAAAPARPQARPGRRTRRRLTWAAATALVAAAGVAAAVITSGGQPVPGGKTSADPTLGTRPRSTPTASARPTPTASTKLTAWTVTKRRDGRVTVTIREMKDVPGLEARLRAEGARVVVTASLAWPAACREWRGGAYRMGDQVVGTENETGLPTADGSEFWVRPTAIPAAALLWIGLAQTGRPKGVVGPPGPISFGYLTATPACERL